MSAQQAGMTAQTYVVSDWARLHLRILLSEALNDLIGIVGGAVALMFILYVALVHTFLVAFRADGFQRWASRGGPVGERDIVALHTERQ